MTSTCTTLQYFISNAAILWMGEAKQRNRCQIITASEASRLGDIISESPGDFVGIRTAIVAHKMWAF